MTSSLLNQPQSIPDEASPETTPADQFERYDTIDTPKIAVVGFISAVLTFVVIVASQAIFFAADNAENDRKTIQSKDWQIEQAVQQQRSRLSNYAWVDAPKNVVRIPIHEAMKRVVADHADASPQTQ